MRSASGGKLAILVILALVAMVARFAPRGDRTGPKRTAHLHVVAFDIAAYALKAGNRMPSSTSDPEFRAALPQEFSELEKRFVFNTKLFGQDTLKMTQAQLQAPLVIQREPLRAHPDRVLLKYVDLEGEEHNVDSDIFPLSDLDDASRQQVTALIAEAKD